MTRPAAIVTGGARGIGLACAEALADAGFNILVADLADRPADGLAKNIAARGAKFAYARGDIADLATHSKLVEAAMAAFGRIDCLVNNAGVGAVLRGDLLELKPENFDRVLSINLRGTVFLSQAVAKAMLAKPSDQAKSIITIILRLESRPVDVGEDPGAATRCRRDRRVRGAAWHHPHRHDIRRCRQI
jgi:NAD(P)-dependent dehydrogenase (short-subunit alcohol dehydrogenase family)